MSYRGLNWQSNKEFPCKHSDPVPAALAHSTPPRAPPGERQSNYDAAIVWTWHCGCHSDFLSCGDGVALPHSQAISLAHRKPRFCWPVDIYIQNHHWWEPRAVKGPTGCWDIPLSLILLPSLAIWIGKNEGYGKGISGDLSTATEIYCSFSPSRVSLLRTDKAECIQF